MRRILPLIVFLLIFLASSQILHARGGGGCLEKGTLIYTPSGSISIEDLRPGDSVLAENRDGVFEARVQDLMRVIPESYYEISCGMHKLRATAEHPIEISQGVFKLASKLKAGDRIRLFDGKRSLDGEISSVENIVSGLPAFNLLVSPGGTYMANGIVVHNKGCFLPDTMIRKADGIETPISAIKVGDRLLAFRSDGEISDATVRKILTHDVDEYMIVKTDRMILRVTVEHPFYVGVGTFKTLEALKAGDFIFAFDGSGMSAQRIEVMMKVKEDVIVYNLQTDAPNTFFANGIAVHNKGGGCFLPDTPIRKTDGSEIAIRFVIAGDKLLAFNEEGKVVDTSVQRVMTHLVDEYIEVRTDRIILNVSSEHPFFVGNGTFRTVGTLKAGDMIYAIDGNHLSRQKIEGIRNIRKSTLVYNLQTDLPNTYFASGIAVHNKGGGGGFRSSRGGGHGGSGKPPTASDLIILIIVATIVVIVFILVKKHGEKALNLDFIFSPFQVSRKTKKTMKLLEFISRQDPSFAPGKLSEIARATFLKLQTCWEARDYAPMQPLMMNDLFSEHNKQIKGMIRNHEINVIASLSIDRIDLVNVRYTLKENRREFTALITATAMDIYIDDRTKEKIRGDDKPSQFQEFWTFHYLDKAWRLREIEQTGESDALKEENFFEQFTDVGVNQVYGDEAGKEGPSGPWLEKEVEVKDTKIERLLNFLVQTDKIWDRQKMTETARRIFLEVTLAWESGAVGNIPKGELFPELYDSLKEDMESNWKNGIKMEFRNLCVRKVELALVRNMSDNTKDEYVARIRAHAQKIMLRKGNVISKDDDVTVFEEYLTFGRMGNMWKLKEVLLQANESGLVKQENIDQDSNAQQLQWYYQHRRAI